MVEHDNNDREYKSNPQRVEFEVENIRNELVENLQKFKDPVVLAMLMKRVSDERESSNRVLKNIFARLDAMEMRLRQLELAYPNAAQESANDAATPRAPRPPILAQESANDAATPRAPRPPILLPDVDFEIMDFARAKKRVCAEDVQKRFKYKGVNAACARLNRLHELGVFGKKQVGRKVYYLPMEVEVQKA
jgi:hypothetical protein